MSTHSSPTRNANSGAYRKRRTSSRHKAIEVHEVQVEDLQQQQHQPDQPSAPSPPVVLPHTSSAGKAALQSAIKSYSSSDSSSSSKISVGFSPDTKTNDGNVGHSAFNPPEEPPTIAITDGTDVSNSDQVHSNWGRFSRKVHGIVTTKEHHDKVAHKKAKKAQKQHEKLQAQRAESLKQLAQAGWIVTDCAEKLPE